MADNVAIDYGWGAPPLGEQLRKQGVAVAADREEWAGKLYDAIRTAYTNRVVSKGEMQKITRRFARRLAGELSPVDDDAPDKCCDMSTDPA